VGASLGVAKPVFVGIICCLVKAMGFAAWGYSLYCYTFEEYA